MSDTGRGATGRRHAPALRETANGTRPAGIAEPSPPCSSGWSSLREDLYVGMDPSASVGMTGGGEWSTEVWSSLGGAQRGGVGCDGQETAALAFGRPSRQLLLPYGKRPTAHGRRGLRSHPRPTERLTGWEPVLPETAAPPPQVENLRHQGGRTVVLPGNSIQLF